MILLQNLMKVAIEAKAKRVDDARSNDALVLNRGVVAGVSHKIAKAGNVGRLLGVRFKNILVTVAEAQSQNIVRGKMMIHSPRELACIFRLQRSGDAEELLGTKKLTPCPERFPDSSPQPLVGSAKHRSAFILRELVAV